MKRCMNCNSIVNESQKACSCGNDLFYDSASNKKGQNEMFCGECGKVINEKAVVCIHCGCSTGKNNNQGVIINNNINNNTESKGSNLGSVLVGYLCLLFCFPLGLICGPYLYYHDGEKVHGTIITFISVFILLCFILGSK